MNKTQTKTFTRKDFTLNRLRVLYDNGIKRWKACRQIRYQVQNPDNNVFMSSELDSLIIILGSLCYKEKYKRVKKYKLSNPLFEVDDDYLKDPESKKNEIRIKKLSEWFKDILDGAGVEFRVWIRHLTQKQKLTNLIRQFMPIKYLLQNPAPTFLGSFVSKSFLCLQTKSPDGKTNIIDTEDFENKFFPEGIIRLISYKHPFGQWAFPIDLPPWSDWVILFITPMFIGSNNQLLKLAFHVEFLRDDFTLTQDLIERLEAIAALVEDKFADLMSGSSK